MSKLFANSLARRAAAALVILSALFWVATPGPATDVASLAASSQA
jgi:hypothetical protein